MRHELQPWPELRGKLELVFGGIPQSGATCIATIRRFSDGHYWNATATAWHVAAFNNAMTEPLAAAGFPGYYELIVPTVHVAYTNGMAGYMIRVECAALNILEYTHVQNAPQTWKEERAAHAGTGTFGQGVNVQQVNTGAIVSGSYAAGAINAAAIATDAIDADAVAADAIDASALAVSAVAKIADGVLDEPMGGHAAGGTLGDFLHRTLALRQQNNRVKYTAWNSAGIPTTAVVYIYGTKSDMDADTGGVGLNATGSYTIAATFDGSLRPTMYTSGKVS